MQTLHEYIRANYIDQAIEGYLAYIDDTEELDELVKEYEAQLSDT